MNDNPEIPEELRKQYLESAVAVCKEHNILLPTFKQLNDPSLIPQKVKDELKSIKVMDINPLNLFRISWYNEPVDDGGLYKDVPNFIGKFSFINFF